MKRNLKLKLQKGLTLIETMMVLGIVMLILFFILDRGVIAKNTAKGSTEISSWVQVFDKTKNRFTMATDTTGATTALLRDFVFPVAWINGTTIRAGKGGTVTVAPADLSGTKDGIAFTVTGAYDKKMCDEIMVGLDSNIYSATVNGTAVKAANVPLDRAALSGACADTNTIVLNITK